MAVDECTEAIECRVTPAMNQQFLAEITMEDVSTALNQMGALKAPGPDGYSASFFQQNWGTIQREVCNAIFHFFHLEELDDHINATNIALVPKKTFATHVTDFRPISLCNVVYKLISKILANRLKVILPDIISPSQSAFIP